MSIDYRLIFWCITFIICCIGICSDTYQVFYYFQIPSLCSNVQRCIAFMIYCINLLSTIYQVFHYFHMSSLYSNMQLCVTILFINMFWFCLIKWIIVLFWSRTIIILIIFLFIIIFWICLIKWIIVLFWSRTIIFSS